jgi:hypothetical protein
MTNEAASEMGRLSARRQKKRLGAKAYLAHMRELASRGGIAARGKSGRPRKMPQDGPGRAQGRPKKIVADVPKTA